MRNLIRRFSRCERGNIAFLTAGAAVPLMIVSLGGLEIADQVSIKKNMQDSADASVLAVFAGGEKSWRKQQKTAKNLFFANLRGRDRLGRVKTRLKRTRVNRKRVFEYTAQVETKSMFGKASLFGNQTITVKAKAVEISINSRKARLIGPSSNGEGEHTVEKKY